MEIQEHNSIARLPVLLEKICATSKAENGIVWVNRKYLKPMTNEALVMAIKPALVGASNPHVFLDGETQLFVVWQEEPQKIYQQLRGLITNALTECDSQIKSSAIVGYIDPSTQGVKLRDVLNECAKQEDINSRAKIDKISGLLASDANFNFEDNEANLLEGASASLMPTPEQTAHYNKGKIEKPYRKQLQILVAEDAAFSQKLLAEIIRGIRNSAGLSPMMDIVPSVQEAWPLFLKKAPDISFIDLRLIDGSGHTLSRAMKELDPSAYVVVLTANDYEEEVAVAQQNNVDGFIVKPYTKKQILDSIDKYIATTKSRSKRDTPF